MTGKFESNEVAVQQIENDERAFRAALKNNNTDAAKDAYQSLSADCMQTNANTALDPRTIADRVRAVDSQLGLGPLVLTENGKLALNADELAKEVPDKSRLGELEKRPSNLPNTAADVLNIFNTKEEAEEKPLRDGMQKAKTHNEKDEFDGSLRIRQKSAEPIRQAIEKFTPDDVKNFCDMTVAIKNNNQEALGAVVERYKDNPEHLKELFAAKDVFLGCDDIGGKLKSRIDISVDDDNDGGRKWLSLFNYDSQKSSYFATDGKSWDEKQREDNAKENAIRLEAAQKVVPAATFKLMQDAVASNSSDDFDKATTEIMAKSNGDQTQFTSYLDSVNKLLQGAGILKSNMAIVGLGQDERSNNDIRVRVKDMNKGTTSLVYDLAELRKLGN